jgi:hypothetical protein
MMTSAVRLARDSGTAPESREEGKTTTCLGAAGSYAGTNRDG